MNMEKVFLIINLDEMKHLMGLFSLKKILAIYIYQM